MPNSKYNKFAYYYVAKFFEDHLALCQDVFKHPARYQSLEAKEMLFKVRNELGYSFKYTDQDLFQSLETKWQSFEFNKFKAN